MGIGAWQPANAAIANNSVNLRMSSSPKAPGLTIQDNADKCRCAHEGTTEAPSFAFMLILGSRSPFSYDRRNLIWNGFREVVTWKCPNYPGCPQGREMERGRGCQPALLGRPADHQNAQ
ncbi:hypothetical protein D3C75_907010 [compost metagenome]